MLTRYRFHLDAEHVASSDPRFVWDADFGGDVDFVDYGRGRITALANYEVFLGNQFRSFDPNQGNYTLDLSASLRFGGNEVFGVFHHISRHLSDRPKVFSVDWNMAGVRVVRRTARGRLEMMVEGRALGVLKRSYVDYTAEIGGGLDLSWAVNPRARPSATATPMGCSWSRGRRARRRTAGVWRAASGCSARTARWTSSSATSAAWTPTRSTSCRRPGSWRLPHPVELDPGGFAPADPPTRSLAGPPRSPLPPPPRLRRGSP